MGGLPYIIRFVRFLTRWVWHPSLLTLLFLGSLLGEYAEAAISATSKIRHLYLTFQHDPSTTITVNIHGIKTPPELIVYYDTSPRKCQITHYKKGLYGTGTKMATLPDGRKIYHIELTHLSPDTTYYLTVGDRMRSFLSKEIVFHTFPADGSPLRLIEGGDWENTKAAEKLAKRAASLNPQALLLGGDYPSRVTSLKDYQEWDRWLDVYTNTMKTEKGYLVPMIMAIGNHEVIGGFGKSEEQIPFFLSYFKQGEGDRKKSYFSLPLGPETHLFVLDSGHAASHGGEQLRWFETELKKTADKKIKIALYHVPLYPSIRFSEKGLLYHALYGIVGIYAGKTSAAKLFSYESAQGRYHWLPLFDRYGMTVAFEHHDQTLKRTKLLREGRENPRGTLYLGDGAWGSEYQYSPLQGCFHNYFVTLIGKVHFFWIVEITKEKIIYTAMSDTGKILDTFTQLTLSKKE